MHVKGLDRFNGMHICVKQMLVEHKNNWMFQKSFWPLRLSQLWHKMWTRKNFLRSSKGFSTFLVLCFKGIAVFVLCIWWKIKHILCIIFDSLAVPRNVNLYKVSNLIYYSQKIFFELSLMEFRSRIQGHMLESECWAEDFMQEFSILDTEVLFSAE